MELPRRGKARRGETEGGSPFSAEESDYGGGRYRETDAERGSNEKSENSSKGKQYFPRGGHAAQRHGNLEEDLVGMEICLRKPRCMA